MPRYIARFNEGDAVCPHCGEDKGSEEYSDYGVLRDDKDGESKGFWFTFICEKCSKYTPTGQFRRKVEVISVCDEKFKVIRNRNKTKNLLKKCESSVSNIKFD